MDMLTELFNTIYPMLSREVWIGLLLGLVFVIYIAPWNIGKVKWRVTASIKTLVTLNKIEDQPRKFGYLRKIDPFVFEEMILTTFKSMGYKIKRNKRYTGDGGLDGKVWINGTLYLIQAKRYSNYINKAHVRDFESLCERHKAKGLFVHTGKTGGGTATVRSQRVSVISGEELLNFFAGDAQVVNTALARI